jgi:hypothetical protein
MPLPSAEYFNIFVIPLTYRIATRIDILIEIFITLPTLIRQADQLQYLIYDALRRHTSFSSQAVPSRSLLNVNVRSQLHPANQNILGSIMPLKKLFSCVFSFIKQAISSWALRLLTPIISRPLRLLRTPNTTLGLNISTSSTTTFVRRPQTALWSSTTFR